MSKEVIVTLEATDKLSGVAATYYRTDSMPDYVKYTGTTDITLVEGNNIISYYSEDKAGNISKGKKS